MINYLSTLQCWECYTPCTPVKETNGQKEVFGIICIRGTLVPKNRLSEHLGVMNRVLSWVIYKK